MRLGVHLPVVDFGDGCPSAATLRDYVFTARDAGFDTAAANDHLRWRRPWLDGPAALAAIAAVAGSMNPAAGARRRSRRLDRLRLQRLPVALRGDPRRAGPALARRGPRPGRVPRHDRYDVAADHRQRCRRGPVAPRRPRARARPRSPDSRPSARRTARALHPGALGVRRGGRPSRAALADPGRRPPAAPVRRRGRAAPACLNPAHGPMIRRCAAGLTDTRRVRWR